MAFAPVAGRYARALFELGVEENEVDALGKALQEAAQLIGESDELRTVIFNPAVELEERRRVFEALGKKGKWPLLFRNFISLLLDKDRLRFIEDIDQSFSEMEDVYKGRARAQVTSAVKLSDPQIQEIRQRLEELTGKKVILNTDVDASLIGGLVARVGNTIYDGSIRTHLERMREGILKEV